MKISASNALIGTVTDIKKDEKSAYVSVDIGGKQTVTAAITLDSLKMLEIEKGKEVFAIVNAWDVMIGTHHQQR